MPYVDNIVCFCGYGFIESMLEPHAKEAGATQVIGNLTCFPVGIL